MLVETAFLLLCAPVPSVGLHESMPMTVPFGVTWTPSCRLQLPAYSHVHCVRQDVLTAVPCVLVYRDVTEFGVVYGSTCRQGGQ